MADLHASTTPRSRPRLIATDLDGTIIRHDGTLSQRTLDAFRRIETAGAQFVIATGRPPRLMDDVAAAFGHRGTAICSNGVFLYDMATKEVVGTNPMPAATAVETARRLREAIPGIGLAVEHAHELDADPVYDPTSWDADAAIRRLDDAELFGGPVPKLVGRHPVLTADEMLELAKPVLEGLVYVYHSNGERLLETIALGVDKGAAVAKWADEAGIDPADVAAFGDMPNDLPLLAWAGTSYGVGGAHPDVLAVVDHIIGGVDEDGVAEVIERLYSAL